MTLVRSTKVLILLLKKKGHLDAEEEEVHDDDSNDCETLMLDLLQRWVCSSPSLFSPSFSLLPLLAPFPTLLYSEQKVPPLALLLC